jgi:hypothetical protein
MLTCSAFRGISCLWTNARHSRCIGIKPKGDGDLERLRQYELPKPESRYASFGERRLFVFTAPFADLDKGSRTFLRLVE